MLHHFPSLASLPSIGADPPELSYHDKNDLRMEKWNRIYKEQESVIMLRGGFWFKYWISHSLPRQEEFPLVVEKVFDDLCEMYRYYVTQTEYETLADSENMGPEYPTVTTTKKMNLQKFFEEYEKILQTLKNSTKGALIQRQLKQIKELQPAFYKYDWLNVPIIHHPWPYISK